MSASIFRHELVPLSSQGRSGGIAAVSVVTIDHHRNIKLSFAYKAGMAFVAFGTAVMVSIFAPFLQVTGVLPSLLGATSVHFLFSYSTLASPSPGYSGVMLRVPFSPVLLRITRLRRS